MGIGGRIEAGALPSCLGYRPSSCHGVVGNDGTRLSTIRGLATRLGFGILLEFISNP